MILEKLCSLFKKIGDKSIEMAEKLENTATQDEFENASKESQEKGDTKYEDVRKLIDREESDIEFEKSREIAKTNPEYKKLSKSQGLLALFNLLLLVLSAGLMFYSLTFLAEENITKFVMVSAAGMLLLLLEHQNMLKLKKRRENIERIEKEHSTFSDEIKSRVQNLEKMKQQLKELKDTAITENNINVCNELRETREDTESFKKTAAIIKVIYETAFLGFIMYSFFTHNYTLVIINTVAYIILGVAFDIYRESKIKKMEKNIEELENIYK